ncbi:Postacrosomal sheath WW domain-binding protein [Trichinella patagoniensis]|uniref:Postacrosomal sheath WW domain-binding protein n=1 Tax=Trichinella patagoniensis TaxID=990121 RepID=A0A0V0ZUK1_9BILA|nr:Postacrosomal sheath WW domain-binding protein [Trichinella patagoniensis]
MAVNVDRTPDGKGIVLYNGELVLLYTKQVNLRLKSAENLMNGNRSGSLYLTTHRLIFTSESKKDPLQSFSIPFHCLRDVKLEQPVFGANYLAGDVMAQPNGNWTGDANFKLIFNHGGCIEFARNVNSYNSPPPYVAVGGDIFQQPPPYYMCQSANAYGVNIPYQAFEPPPPGVVFVTSAPPPYTGLFVSTPATASAAGAHTAMPANPPPYEAAATSFNYPPIPTPSATAPPYPTNGRQNGANEENTTFIDMIRAEDLEKELRKSGKYLILAEILRIRLEEYGVQEKWREIFRQALEEGSGKVSLTSLQQHWLPLAREAVPESVKQELISQILNCSLLFQKFYSRTVENIDQWV